MKRRKYFDKIICFKYTYTSFGEMKLLLGAVEIQLIINPYFYYPYNIIEFEPLEQFHMILT